MLLCELCGRSLPGPSEEGIWYGLCEETCSNEEEE